MDNIIIKELKEHLDLSIIKKSDSNKTVSVALSQSGKKYFGGIVESDTNTFNLPAEHVSLMLSTISNDYKVCEIVTLTEEEPYYISPLILKIIIDHSIRTGIPIKYTILNKNSEIIYKQDPVEIHFYKPKNIILSRTEQKPDEYTQQLDENIDKIKTIKEFAIKGLLKNFPLYDSASGYATAVLTKNMKIFFAGQYSSPDKRLGMHSEVNTILASLMNRETDITHIGLVSSKYTDTVCQMCGNCRQFISEMASKFNFNPVIYLFAKENNNFIEQNIDNYLPSKWTSKNW